MKRFMSVLLFCGFLALIIPSTAFAETADPQADQLSQYAGSYGSLDVLANDTDPNGLALKVCDHSDIPESQGFLSLTDGLLSLYINEGVMEPIDFDYANCNGRDEVWHHGTVTVLQAINLIVRKVHGQPGYLKVTNKNTDLTGEVLYGSFAEMMPDGYVDVAPSSTLVFKIRKGLKHRHADIDWVGSGFDSKDTFLSLGSGTVTNVHYPSVDVATPRMARPTSAPMNKSALKLWNSHN